MWQAYEIGLHTISVAAVNTAVLGSYIGVNVTREGCTVLDKDANLQGPCGAKVLRGMVKCI